ncbi:MAG: trigger factor [Clostridia bacterium]|nr:trigger factor [Clostridia bacterium]
MKAILVSKENNEAKFTMEFTAEEFESAQIQVYKETKDQFQINGFRKGKAPRSIIEKTYGEGVFFEEAINNMFQEAYPEALDQLDLEPIASPKADFSEIAKGKGFTVTITVAVEPEFEVKDYMGVKVEKVVNEVSDEDINKELEALQNRNARIVSVDREAKIGDTVILDYAGFVGEEQFAGGTADGQELVLGSGMFIPGFEEQLVGTKAGDKKDVEVTFPEQYQAEELAGKDAVFHCLVHEVKEKQLPELDDDFAQDVSEFDTLEELKNDTKERLTKYAEQAAETDMKEAIIDKICEANEVEIPASMIDEEVQKMTQELNQQLQYQGLSLDQYLQFTNSDLASFQEQVKPDAEKRVKSRLILDNIVRIEGIEVTDEDVDEELNMLGAQYQMDAAKVREIMGERELKYIRKDVQTRKLVDKLFENAKLVAPKKKKEDK